MLISELRAFTWRTADGGTARGGAILDPIWARMVKWHGQTERDLAASRTRASLETQILAARGEAAGRRLLARLDALDERLAAPLQHRCDDAAFAAADPPPVESRQEHRVGIRP